MNPNQNPIPSLGTPFTPTNQPTPSPSPSIATTTTTIPSSSSSSRPRSGSNAAPTNQPRRVVGDYYVHDRIGSGSFASVWRGSHKVSGLEVAIKSISKDKLLINKKHEENLDLEITIMSRIQHPNIVKLYEVRDTPRHKYLILEYCGGGDLSKYLRRNGAMSERAAKGFLGQLASGLMFLRQANLIHRDLKPQNLLLDSDSPEAVLKIADFGFARYMEPNNLAATLCGSPLYMAPEVLGSKEYDASVDLWSVGGILFEMVTGKPPFTGQNHIQLLNRINTTDLKFPTGLDLTPSCMNLLYLLLKRNPRERITFEQFFVHPFVVEAMAMGAQIVSKREAAIEAASQAAAAVQAQQQNQMTPSINAAASSISRSLQPAGLSTTPPQVNGHQQQQVVQQQQQQRGTSHLYGSSPTSQPSQHNIPNQQHTQQQPHSHIPQQLPPNNSPPSPSFLLHHQSTTPPNGQTYHRSPLMQQVGFQPSSQPLQSATPSSFSPPSPAAERQLASQQQQQQQQPQQQPPRPISRHNTPQYLRASGSGGGNAAASTSSLNEYVLVENANVNSHETSLQQQQGVMPTTTHNDDDLADWKENHAYLLALWSRGGTYAKLGDSKLVSLLNGFLPTSSAVVIMNLLDELKLSNDESSNAHLSINATALAQTTPQKLLLDALTLYVKGLQLIQLGRQLMVNVIAASNAALTVHLDSTSTSPTVLNTMRECHDQRLAIQSRFDSRAEQFQGKAERVRRALEELQTNSSTIRLGGITTTTMTTNATHSRRASGSVNENTLNISDETLTPMTLRASPSIHPLNTPTSTLSPTSLSLLTTGLVTDCAEKLLFDASLESAKQMVHALFVGDTPNAHKSYELAMKMLEALVKEERALDKDRIYFQEIEKQIQRQYEQYMKKQQHSNSQSQSNSQQIQVH